MAINKDTNKNTNKKSNSNTNNTNNSYLENIVKSNIKSIVNNKIKPKKKKKNNTDDSIKKKLTLKQKRFIDNYIISANATDAAIKAGYSKKTAAQCGADNLRKLYIKQAIEEQLKKIEDKKIATATEIMQMLTQAARGQWDEEQIIVEGLGGGITKSRKYKKGIAPKDRLKAAELLAKRFGMLTEKVEVKDDRTKENATVDILLKSLKERDAGFEDEDNE